MFRPRIILIIAIQIFRLDSFELQVGVCDYICTNSFVFVRRDFHILTINLFYIISILP